MKYAAFRNEDDARSHRERHGGWLFIVEGGMGETIWFSPEFCPTAIFTHRVLQGLNGLLA